MINRRFREFAMSRKRAGNLPLDFKFPFLCKEMNAKKADEYLTKDLPHEDHAFASISH